MRFGSSFSSGAAGGRFRRGTTIRRWKFLDYATSVPAVGVATGILAANLIVDPPAPLGLAINTASRARTVYHVHPGNVAGAGVLELAIVKLTPGAALALPVYSATIPLAVQLKGQILGYKRIPLNPNLLPRLHKVRGRTWVVEAGPGIQIGLYARWTPFTPASSCLIGFIRSTTIKAANL